MKFEGARLRPWQEVVGILDGVEAYNESIVISISSKRCVSLEIPIGELNEEFLNLGQLKGQRISILRTDEGYVLKPRRQDDDDESKTSRGCD